MKKLIRSYLKVINEFINVQTPFDVEILGSLSYDQIYPFISFHSHSKLAKYNVVINAGAHGTESIGVRIMLRFFQEFNKEFLGYYNFMIFPILNPYGYAHGTRKNGNKQKANWGLNHPNENLPPESIFIKENIPHKVDLFMDIHADNKGGFYVYERKRPDKPSLADQSLKILHKHKIPVHGADSIYQEKCINGVVVRPDKDGSMDDSMFQRGAMYSLCIEVPTQLSEDEQIIGGLLLINEVLNQFRDIK